MSDLPPQLKDFRNLLWMTWNHLSLPAPTPIKYEIAEKSS